jgi:two-component sensor histidine kinase
MLDERRQSLAILGALAACTIGTVVVHGVLGLTVWITHSYYVPVVLACLWWGRRSILVPIYLAVLVLASSILFLRTPALVDNVIRVGIMFLIYAGVSYAIATVRRAQYAEGVISRRLGELARGRLDMLREDNAVLLESVGQRAGANGSPEASAELNELLVSEIGTRMRNNLQTIDSLLHFASIGRAVEDPAEIADDTDGRLYTIARIHEVLSRPDANECFRVDAFLEGLVDHLVAAYAEVPIRVRLQVTALELPRDLAVPVGLVVNELVVNALRHAFADMPTGTIGVQVHLRDGSAEIVVRDDGVGLSEAALRHKGDGDGLALISSMVEHLEGKVEVFHEPGATFIIRLPLEVECVLSP